MQVCNDITKHTTLRKAVAIGQFDGVHLGHQALIKSCVKLAKNNDLSPCVITFTNHKNENLIFNFKQKIQLIETFGIELLFNINFNDIKSLSGEEFVILLKKNNFNLIACGFDFVCGKDRSCNAYQLKELCEKYGIICHIQNGEYFKDKKISSTNLRTCLSNGKMDEFKELSGNFYKISGKVQTGSQIGRTINIPTANQALDTTLCLPKFGVYSTLTVVDDKIYRSVTNIGKRPTFLSDPLCETFIIDFFDNIYNKNIDVFFIKYLREEIKFNSIDELKLAINNDINDTIIFFENNKIKLK